MVNKYDIYEKMWVYEPFKMRVSLEKYDVCTVALVLVCNAWWLWSIINYLL